MGLSIDYVPTLKRLGLTEYEAKIYAAVVGAGSKTAGELSFLSGVPRTKLYGSLRSLEKKGLVRTVSRKPETFAANSPNESLLPLAESLVKEAGEGLTNPTAGALANAVFHATGVSIKNLPITPGKVLNGLKEKRHQEAASSGT